MPNNSSLNNSIYIRRALNSDSDEIARLHNAWAIRNLDSDLDKGFLLLETTPTKIRQLNSENHLLLVAVTNSIIVGYVVAVDFPEMLDSLKWSENLKATILGQPHMHISEMAVDKNYVGRGIGRHLYSEIFVQSAANHFSAYVATAPFRNQSSISFHERIGFRSVATFHSKNFCGIENYSSTLFYLNNPKYQ
jgi:L-amino acid N-acyltransferase YncA